MTLEKALAIAGNIGKVSQHGLCWPTVSPSVVHVLAGEVRRLRKRLHEVNDEVELLQQKISDEQGMT